MGMRIHTVLGPALVAAWLSGLHRLRHGRARRLRSRDSVDATRVPSVRCSASFHTRPRRYSAVAPGFSSSQA